MWTPKPMITGSMTIKRNSSIDCQTVFFDFDGVIVESTEIKTRAFRKLYSEYVDVLDDVVAYHGAHEGTSRLEKIFYYHKGFWALN
jgi:hypothetical protein